MTMPITATYALPRHTGVAEMPLRMDNVVSKLQTWSLGCIFGGPGRVAYSHVQALSVDTTAVWRVTTHCKLKANALWESTGCPEAMEHITHFTTLADALKVVITEGGKTTVVEFSVPQSADPARRS